MALDTDEEAWVEGLLQAYIANPSKASVWERGFMTDQVARWEEHGSETTFTSKQWAILDRVAEKLKYEGRE
jgi:hypothetical protein